MYNLTTKITQNLGFGSRTRITKTFNTIVLGRKLTISVYRNEDKNFKSKNYYTLEYKGQKFGSHNMGKSQLKWQLDFMKTDDFKRLFEDIY